MKFSKEMKNRIILEAKGNVDLHQRDYERDSECEASLPEEQMILPRIARQRWCVATPLVAHTAADNGDTEQLQMLIRKGQAELLHIYDSTGYSIQTRIRMIILPLNPDNNPDIKYILTTASK